MITTHVLDTSRGRPAAGVPVVLSAADGRELGRGETDADGRLRTLVPPGTHLPAGDYVLTFHTGAYFPDGLYPRVSITFTVRETGGHYHIPLLLSPFGYSTYRGS